MKLIYDILASLYINSSLIYIWHNLLNKKINFKSIKLYITFISLTIITLLNYFLVNNFIKIIIITIIFMLFFRFLFKEGLQKSILTPIYYQIILIVSEILYAFVVIIFDKTNNEIILNTYIGTFMANIIISSVAVILSKFKIVKKIYNKILKFTDKIKYIQLFLLCFVALIIVNIILAATFYNIEYIYLFLFNILIMITSFIIIFYSVKTKNNYNTVSDKYNIAITSLKDLENMISKNKIDNHENKNLLLTIRAMAVSKEENIPEYIDSILEEKYNDDEKLLQKMNVIPSGGLRATIYSEILKIKDNNIKYFLNIDKRFKTIDFIEMETNTIIDICKIIGVLIDNAIDEVKKLSDKIIMIELFSDKKTIKIKITNKYITEIELDKLYNAGYSTKGSNHGYGLALVKDIVDNNTKLNIKYEINKENFSQILVIDNKKSH